MSGVLMSGRKVRGGWTCVRSGHPATTDPSGVGMR